MSEASQSEHQTPAPLSQQTGEEETRPRRWWAALFWALLSPVAGYLYVGRIWRALFALLATLAIYAALQFDPTGLVATRFGFYALVAAALALTLYFLFDIVRSAIRRRDYRRRFWNHWLLYGAVVLLMFFAPDLATLQTELPRKGAEPFSIASASMRPTLPPGALFVVDRSVDPRADLKRGDVIVFRHPRTPSEIYVKRLIGLPGDQISLRDGVVSLNGAALAQTVVKRPFGAPALTPDERPGTADASSGGGDAGRAAVARAGRRPKPV